MPPSSREYIRGRRAPLDGHYGSTDKLNQVTSQSTPYKANARCSSKYVNLSMLRLERRLTVSVRPVRSGRCCYRRRPGFRPIWAARRLLSAIVHDSKQPHDGQECDDRRLHVNHDTLGPSYQHHHNDRDPAADSMPISHHHHGIGLGLLV